jgi:ubiquinone biosynthesis protein UbiJ
VSWVSEVYTAIRRIILLEDRVENLTAQVKDLADSYAELDRRLIRLEAKFELIERIGGAARRALPEPGKE